MQEITLLRVVDHSMGAHTHTQTLQFIDENTGHEDSDEEQQLLQPTVKDGVPSGHPSVGSDRDGPE